MYYIQFSLFSQGMIYLHESDLAFHGNLRSTNCLVDTRWVLQISGFGFRQLKGDMIALAPSTTYVGLNILVHSVEEEDSTLVLVCSQD